MPAGSDSRRRLVVIRDPSVRDYLWARLEEVDGESEVLLEQAVFFEQCIILYEGRSHANWMRTIFSFRTHTESRNRDVVNQQDVVSRAIDLIDSSSPVVRRVRLSTDEDSVRIIRAPVNLERRTAFLMRVLAEHPDDQAAAVSANSGLAAATDEWEAGRGSPVDGVELFNQANKVEDMLDKGLFERAETSLLLRITSQLEQPEDFEALATLYIQNPRPFQKLQRNLKWWADEFEYFIEGERDWLLKQLSDADWLEQEIGNIMRLAEAFEMDVTELELDVENRLEDLRAGWEPAFDDDLPEFYTDPTGDQDEQAVDALFQSLRGTGNLRPE